MARTNKQEVCVHPIYTDIYQQHKGCDNEVDYYTAYLLNTQDYYPFGMLMPGRTFTDPASKYRYGHNTQEKDDEITGANGSHYTAEYWEYDSRLGRRWNIDPVIREWESPYATFNGNPILVSDPNMSNATGGEKYDFKRTNLIGGKDNSLYDDPENHYRGMPLFGQANGKPIYASARDIGNMAAGIVAACAGMSWTTARLGFDALETYQHFSVIPRDTYRPPLVIIVPTAESTSTQMGQKLCFTIGAQMFQNK